MPKTKRRSKTPKTPKKPIKTGLRRVIINDPNYTDYTNLSGNISFNPSMSRRTVKRIKPTCHKDNIDKSDYLTFHINSNIGEVLSFRDHNQLFLEVDTLVEEITLVDKSFGPNTVKCRPANLDANGVTTTKLALADNNWMWAPTTDALSLFDECNIELNGTHLDNTTTWPSKGLFLCHIAVFELMFSGSEKLLQQEELKGHIVPWNRYKLSEVNKVKTIGLAKLATASDDTRSRNVPSGTKKFSKLISASIPLPPFRSLSRFAAKDLEILGDSDTPRNSHKILLPPLSDLKIHFKRNRDFPLKYIGDYTKIDVDDILAGGPRDVAGKATGPGDNVRSIKVRILDAYLNVTSEYPTSGIRNQYQALFNYGRFCTVNLLHSSHQEHTLSWTGTKPPDIMLIYFCRSQDLNPESSKEISFSTNRFYLPKGLESILVKEKTSPGFNSFNGFELRNLHLQDKDESKMNYYETLKLEGILPESVLFEDYFSINEDIECGYTNVFPLSFKRIDNIETSILTRGFNVELKFSGGALNTDWKMIAYFAHRGVYQVKYPPGADDATAPEIITKYHH